MNHFRLNFNELVEHFKSSQFRWLICFVFLTSCRDKVGVPVDVNVAQQTLVSAMESWKEGKTPDDLLSESPSIVVQEAEWENGTTLLDYQVVSDEMPTGPNLVAMVKLKLSKADGTVAEKTATYVVGTSPKLTVYRNLMR